MALFLGVDGGQSSTVALIANETGRILGSGIGGPCNHVAADEGRAKFARAIQGCLGNACREAGLDVKTITFEAACLGFSGGVADKDAYSRELIRSNLYTITHDAEIALTGATAGHPGMIVIAGTGSIAFGKNAAGQTARAGGWGYIFGDEGGAFDIARQALRASLAMEEGWGPPTSLRAALLDWAVMPSANLLMHDCYNRFDRKKIAQFAPMVDRAAQAGDAVASEILSTAGRQLAALAFHISGMLMAPPEKVVVSFIGGVFESLLLTNSFRMSVREALDCETHPPALPPAAGALIQAFASAGHRIFLSGMPMIKS